MRVFVGSPIHLLEENLFVQQLENVSSLLR